MMAEVTAMEAMDMLRKSARSVSRGALLDFQKNWSTDHWREDSTLLVMDFDPSNPETVKAFLEANSTTAKGNMS